MEIEGYLKPEDEQALITELTGYGLYDINLTGTTKTEVDYGDRIYLKITGTYDDNILAFAGGVSQVASHPDYHYHSASDYGKTVRRPYVGEERSNRRSRVRNALYHGDHHGYHYVLYACQCKAYDDPA